jgi:hypothetical protein
MRFSREASGPPVGLGGCGAAGLSALLAGARTGSLDGTDCANATLVQQAVARRKVRRIGWNEM